MNETLLAGVMFVVSAGSTAVHCVAWWRLTHGPDAVGRAEQRIRRGLVRTVVCRILAAVVYIGVAAVTVVARPALPVVALAVFTGTQLLWQCNSFLDVRLRRDLAGAAAGRGQPRGSRDTTLSDLTAEDTVPYTTHGHWFGLGAPTAPQPRLVTRCGGPHLCTVCALEAQRAEEGVMQPPRFGASPEDAAQMVAMFRVLGRFGRRLAQISDASAEAIEDIAARHHIGSQNDGDDGIESEQRADDDGWPPAN